MNIHELCNISLRDLQDALANKEVSPVELVDLTLDQTEAVNQQINALYGVRHDDAREEAKASEKRFCDGKPIGPFDGIPVTIKDSVNATGMKWFHGTCIHGDGVVAKKDSPPAARLKEAGTIIIGKGAMPDFGLSGSGVSGSHGIVRNPWGLEWNTGGSSAGGAASLARFRYRGISSPSCSSLRLGFIETDTGCDSACASIYCTISWSYHQIGCGFKCLDHAAECSG